MRNYDLKMAGGTPCRGPRAPIADPDWAEGVGKTPQSTDDDPTGWDAIERGIKANPPEEHLPMHRACGDEVATPHGRGTVRSIKRGIALIQCGSRWYVEQGQSITEVEDHMLCPHCGGVII